MTEEIGEIGKQFGNMIMNMMDKKDEEIDFENLPENLAKTPECELFKQLDGIKDFQGVMNGLLNCVMEKTSDWSKTPEEETKVKEMFSELRDVVVPFLADKQIKMETPLKDLCKDLQEKVNEISFEQFNGTLCTLEELETYRAQHGVDFVKQEYITTFDNEADGVKVTQKKHVITILHKETNETYEYITTMTNNMKLNKVCLQST